MLKRLFQFALGALLVLLAALLANTASQRSRQLQVAPPAAVAIDLAGASARLAGALKFTTIASETAPSLNAGQFAQLRAYLQAAYPRLHAQLQREVVGNGALLYRWEGSEAQALPLLWMAHQDVVPVAAGTEQNWSAPPFNGVIKDGYIWGRGAWDDKGNLCAQLEALEMLVASGFRPRRTLYLAFGDDEEVGGTRGAAAIAALLRQRGVRLDYVLDEGLLVTDGMLKGLDRPAALIGVAEKGYLTLKLEVAATPGHSSMPQPRSAIGQMSAALARLEKHPMPADLHGVARTMLETVAPDMHGLNRLVLTNLWLFKPLVERELAAGPATNAMLRTTTALTMVHAGERDNVLPGLAEATINLRLLPGDTQESAIAHVRQALDNDAIKITPGPSNVEASAISPTAGAPYLALNRTIREVFSDAIVAPGLMIGASDSRHFAALSDHVLRFTPVRATPADLERFHGTNERLSLKNYGEMIRFYRQLLLNTAG
ncbi:MAG: M20 family peptidase [Pseudomonadota bacterium]